MSRRIRALVVAVLAMAGLLTVTGSASAEAPPDGSFVYLKFAHSGGCVSVPNDWHSDVQLIQWSCIGKQSQRFQWDFYEGDIVHGHYWGQLRNLVTNKCLMPQNGWKSDGVAMIQTTCLQGDYRQLFEFAHRPEMPSGYNWIVSRWSGKVVNVSGAATGNGGKLIQYPAQYVRNSYVTWVPA